VDEYYEALQSLVQRLGIASKVTFYGHIDRPEAWYHKIDIFVSNSYSEGLQVSPLEAIASGCYGLSHYWEGADELFPAENLYFSSQELNEKILRYCDQTETERKIEILRGHAAVRARFDVDKTKGQIRQQIEAAGASYDR
jgi:glycosyltransferase involved in cell wall biosynthesis